MSDINFYHLQRSSLETVLPKLLEKTMDASKRALVLTNSPRKAEQLAAHLWTYDPASWMPHGTEKDGSPEDQPIWLSDVDENSNDASFLFLTDGARSAALDDFERCFVLFDGNNESSLGEARQYWTACKDGGHDLAYWQQNDRGGWDKKQ